MQVYLQAVVGTTGVAAVAVFGPVGAEKESAHLAVVATLGEHLDEVDEFVAFAVTAMPFYGDNSFGTHTTGETVGEELFNGKAVLNIATFGEVIYQLGEPFWASRHNLVSQIEMFVGIAQPAHLREIVVGQAEAVTVDILRRRYGCGFGTGKDGLDDSPLTQFEGLDIVSV